MGSWDATCSLSNLSIGYKDRVVAWLVTSNSQFYNPWEWKPFGGPIRGTYNTYGGIDPDTGELDNLSEFLPATIDDVSEFLKVGSGESEKDNNSRFFSSEATTTVKLILIHESVYDEMLTYFKDETYEYDFTNHRSCFDYFNDLASDAYSSPKFHVIDGHIAQHEPYERVSGYDFFFARRRSITRGLSSSEILTAVEALISVYMFNILRKSFTPEICAGSQTTNYKETALLSKVTHKLSKKFAKEFE